MPELLIHYVHETLRSSAAVAAYLMILSFQE